MRRVHRHAFFLLKSMQAFWGRILGRFRRLKRAKKTRQKTLCAHTLMLIIGNLCTVLCNWHWHFIYTHSDVVELNLSMGAALCVFVVADYTLQFNSVTYDKLGSATYTCVCVPIDIYATNMVVNNNMVNGMEAKHWVSVLLKKWNCLVSITQIPYYTERPLWGNRLVGQCPKYNTPTLHNMMPWPAIELIRCSPLIAGGGEVVPPKKTIGSDRRNRTCLRHIWPDTSLAPP